MTKLTVEEQFQLADDIYELMKEYTGNPRHAYSGLWGMARATLTDDQLLTMKGMLTRWVEERRQGEVA